MDLRNGSAMRMALRLRNQAIYRKHVVLNLLRQLQVIPYNVLNVRHGSVMMVMTMSLVIVMRIVVMFVVMFMFMIMVVIVIMVVMVVLLVIMEMLVRMLLVMMVMMLAMVVIMLVVMIMVLMVMLVLVMVVVAFFFLAMDLHGHMRARDAALYGRLPMIFNARDLQCVQLRHKSFRIRQEFQKRCRQHVTCGTHATVKV